jgi:multidrug resistance protein MdtO
MSPSAELEADAAGRSWLAFLRAELSPAPGRFDAAVRITVATLIVLITSMALQVPSAALSIFIVFYISTQSPGPAAQNSTFVAIAAVAAVAALTLSIGATLLLYRLTIDYPPLRLAAMALGFFLGMFVSRVFVMGGLGFVVGFVLLVTQSYVDLFPGGEPLVRAVLWVWMAIVYPAAVAVGVNLILLPPTGSCGAKWRRAWLRSGARLRRRQGRMRRATLPRRSRTLRCRAPRRSSSCCIWPSCAMAR